MSPSSQPFNPLFFTSTGLFTQQLPDLDLGRSSYHAVSQTPDISIKPPSQDRFTFRSKGQTGFLSDYLRPATSYVPTINEDWENLRLDGRTRLQQCSSDFPPLPTPTCHIFSSPVSEPLLPCRHSCAWNKLIPENDTLSVLILFEYDSITTLKAWHENFDDVTESYQNLSSYLWDLEEFARLAIHDVDEVSCTHTGYADSIIEMPNINSHHTSEVNPFAKLATEDVVYLERLQRMIEWRDVISREVSQYVQLLEVEDEDGNHEGNEEK